MDCGYNLWGLPGDPRRCPECGTLNPVSDSTIPAKEIAKQLKKLETLPTWCVAASWAALGAILVQWITGNPYALILFVPAAIAWALVAYQFGKTCGFRLNWLTVLGWFHLVGLVWFTVLVGGAAVMFYFADTIPDRWEIVLFIPYVLLAVVIGPITGMRPRRSGYAGIYGIAKERLARLCRETAVSLARQYASKAKRP